MSLVAIYFFLRLLGNDDVIYEVIMQKFRASMEPFWDLKFGEYVEYIMRVSSEYLTSSVLPSLTSGDGWTSHILLADVIPWIYIDSPMLYIARTTSSVPLDCSEAVLDCWVLLCTCDWSFETCHYWGQEPLSDYRWSESSVVCNWGAETVYPL